MLRLLPSIALLFKQIADTSLNKLPTVPVSRFLVPVYGALHLVNRPRTDFIKRGWRPSRPNSPLRFGAHFASLPDPVLLRVILQVTRDVGYQFLIVVKFA